MHHGNIRTTSERQNRPSIVESFGKRLQQIGSQRIEVRLVASMNRFDRREQFLGKWRELPGPTTTALQKRLPYFFFPTLEFIPNVTIRGVEFSLHRCCQ